MEWIMFKKLIVWFSPVIDSWIFSDIDEIRAKDKLKEISEVKKSIAQTREDILHIEEERVLVNNEIIEQDTHLKNLLAHKKRLNLDKGRLDNYLEQNKEKSSNIEEAVAKLAQASALRWVNITVSTPSSRRTRFISWKQASILDK